MKKIEFFKVEGDKINRIRKHCPKCGPGVFIAEHKDRFSCGKCGYTEFKGGGRKQQKSITQEKAIEQPPVEEPTVENQSSKIENKSFEEASDDFPEKENPSEDNSKSDEKKQEAKDSSEDIKKESEPE